MVTSYTTGTSNLINPSREGKTTEGLHYCHDVKGKTLPLPTHAKLIGEPSGSISQYTSGCAIILSTLDVLRKKLGKISYS